MTGSDDIRCAVLEYGLSPKQVVIAIPESGTADRYTLHQTAGVYREQGFLIALTDIRPSQADFEHIHGIKPDILKLGRPLIDCIEHQAHKQALFDFLRLWRTKWAHW